MVISDQNVSKMSTNTNGIGHHCNWFLKVEYIYYFSLLKIESGTKVGKILLYIPHSLNHNWKTGTQSIEMEICFSDR